MSSVGPPTWNFPAFAEAAKTMRGAGYEVVSPAELDGAPPAAGEEKPWAEYMRRDLAELLKCDAILMLEGWENSTGARLELEVAQRLGMNVYIDWGSAILGPVSSPLYPTILDEAAEAVDGPRQADYGPPEENHARTAALWNAYLAAQPDISATDVCVLNILQKLSRGRHRMTRDTLVDVAGYARNIEILQGVRAPSSSGAPRRES
jgi:hypothetical protein